MSLHLFPKGLAADTQAHRGFADGAVARLDRGDQEGPFGSIEELGQRKDARIQSRGRRLRIVREKVRGADRLATGESHGSPKYMVELPRVSRPVDGRRGFAARLGTAVRTGEPRSTRQLREHPLGQPEDVFAPLAQRRDLDRDDIDAVVEVFAELAARTIPWKIAMRRADQPEIDRSRPSAPIRVTRLS